MQPFETLTALAAPLPAANVDTDIIFPARFLLLTERLGLGPYAFYEWRYGEGEAPNPDFVLNQPAYRDARILIAGENFGCGSSREQACWALLDAGFQAVIAPSFGEIFFGNCCKNGMVPIVVSPADLKALLADAQALAPMTVDLERQEVVRADGERIAFPMEKWRSEALLNGWDEVDIILNRSADAIGAFEARARGASPWLFEET